MGGGLLEGVVRELIEGIESLLFETRGGNLEEKRKAANELIRRVAKLCAGIGGASGLIPLVPDAFFITPLQLSMVAQLGAIYGAKLSHTAALALVQSFFAPLVGRTISRTLLGWIPGLGIVVRSITAYTITLSLGKAVQLHFEREYLRQQNASLSTASPERNHMHPAEAEENTQAKSKGGSE
ncbi:MAG: hypothetical protein RMJ84_08050 [Sandaracinaceae bacterium]|nr:hypothetical protein [Sandaracinaceae bacterium]